MMMQEMGRNRWSLWLAGGLAALAVSGPAQAASIVKEAVNRTGAPQPEIFAYIRGLPPITDVVVNEPFAGVQGFPVLSDLGFDTVLRWFNAPNGAIPAVVQEDVTAPATARTGFSVADHEFVIARWSWCGPNLSPEFRRIADPSVHFGFVGDPRDRVVQFTFRNDSGEEVELQNIVMSVRSGSPSLRGVPLLVGPNDRGSFQGERVLDRMGGLTLPPASTPDNNEPGVARLTMQIPEDVSLEDLNVLCRCILYRRVRQGNTTVTDRANPVSFAVWDDLSRTYPPRLFEIAAKSEAVPNDSTKRRVHLSLAARDPDSATDGSAPAPTIDPSVAAEAGTVAVRGVTRKVEPDHWGRPVTRINVEADLKLGSAVRYFRFRFTAKSEGESATRDIHLWLHPTGQLYGSW